MVHSAYETPQQSRIPCFTGLRGFLLLPLQFCSWLIPLVKGRAAWEASSIALLPCRWPPGCLDASVIHLPILTLGVVAPEDFFFTNVEAMIIVALEECTALLKIRGALQQSSISIKSCLVWVWCGY